MTRRVTGPPRAAKITDAESLELIAMWADNTSAQIARHFGKTVSWVSAQGTKLRKKGYILPPKRNNGSNKRKLSPTNVTIKCKSHTTTVGGQDAEHVFDFALLLAEEMGGVIV